MLGSRLLSLRVVRRIVRASQRGPMNTPWKCPKCGAAPEEHGKGGKEKCVWAPHSDICLGFICHCDDDGTSGHGESLANRCPAAVCHHCDWYGKFPVIPRGLQPWEKKALEAGWVMPEARKKELMVEPNRRKR